MTDVAIGAPAYLPPAFRYVGNDWAGGNALLYTVWQTLPVFAADGVTVVTAGVPQNLAGFGVQGLLHYQRRCGARSSRAALPSPVAAIIDVANGVMSLSLSRAQTAFERQPITAWGDPTSALLLAEPQVIDTSGNLLTLGFQPVFTMGR